MSTARHHAEWLSLVEASGPFLSLPVLLKVFPQGLEAHDSEHMRRLRLAYEEWADNQQGLKPDKAIHRAWVEFVLGETLELPKEMLLSGQAVPNHLQVTVAEQGETLRPDWVVMKQGQDAGKPRLLIQAYPPEQGLEKGVKGSRWAASPATRMMELLHACDVRLGLVTNGEHWLLVNAPKGETTGYISWYATLWQEETVTLRAFRSLLGLERFFGVPDDETLEAMLAESVNSQQEVTDQLGFQVRKAVEVLVQAIDRIDLDRGRELLEGVSETRLYEAALTVMMRLVFLFFAEENKLIPPQESEFYDAFYAMSTLREQLRTQADQHGEEILERKQDAWCRLLATFRAVYSGVNHDELYIPAYGGSLFNPDRFPFLEGRKAGDSWREVAAEPIPVNNRTVLHLLEALQILQVSVRGVGVESRKLSFRALDIEQIGHVYEGLLDHTAVRAAEPILGLEGTKNKEPEVSLNALEAHWEKGEAALVEFLKKETGRSVSALKKRVPKQSGEKGGGSETGQEAQRLLIACNNDQALFERVLPWVELMRLDTFDYPLVIPAGSVFVTQGSDRRETGTHYTPRSLTEEIVKYTLEPLVYEGVAEGKPKADWRLKSSAALLQLKVCDMAMGSGAFLVQVCRYLSERLVEAWEDGPHPSPLPRERGPEGGSRLGAAGERGPEGGSRLGAAGERDIEMERVAGWARQIPRSLLERARELRQVETPAEDILWECLRDRRLQNAKFRRQHNIDRFIADFYCHQARLVVELDGAVHDTAQARDAIRDDWMIQHGFRVLRFDNQQVFEDLQEVLASISEALALSSQDEGGPHPLTPSPQGEGEQEAVVPLSRGRGARGEGRGARGEGLRILPDGSLSATEPGEAILPADPDERLAVARRIVADRCLYGVDKNPMAVEMAKLSLWLITLQINKPFTFLDHALRCGDSLLGVTDVEQIIYFNLNPQKSNKTQLVAAICQPILETAIAKRKELEGFAVNDIQDLQRKEKLLLEVEEALSEVRFIGDLLIGESLNQSNRTANLVAEELEALKQSVEHTLLNSDSLERQRQIRALKHRSQRMLNVGKPSGQPPREPFHWALEFPEVFEDGERSGFDAIVGNPPFQGGQKITGALGTEYRNFLVEWIANGQRGSADLCAYFFLRAGSVLQAGGDFGLIATNTIAQGDTREVGLDQLSEDGYTIPRAVPSRPWPGTAALEVAHVWLRKGKWQGKAALNEQTVEGITPFLTVPGKAVGKPHRLAANQGKSFIGSYVLGLGFTMPPEEAQALIEKNPKNKDVLFPYLNGQDLNTNPDQSPSRWVINFKDWPLDAEHDDPKKPKGPPYAADYPDCLAIVREKVKPERDKNKRKVRRERWWQFAEIAPALYGAIAGCDRVLVKARVSPIHAFVWVNPGTVFNEQLVVCPFEDSSAYALLQCSLHEQFAIEYCSTFGKATIRYSPSDGFETFPFPKTTHTLAPIGQRYYTHRQSIMQSRQEGLTKTYNHFHDPTHTDPDIQTLRDLHIEMDTAVAAAYGWHDLLPSPRGRGAGGEGLDHGFHQTKQGLRFTISEAARREVLDRLLALNHQRYAEEKAQGLHDKKKKKKSSKRKPKQKKQADPSVPIQGSLL